jgi:Tfp pilus assembly protein FimT
MQSTQRIHEAGASIFELVIVMVVVLILSVAAVTKLGSARGSINRQNAARQFKVELERARFDSIKRRASVCSDMARVTINDATSFSVTTDSNQNGRLDVPAETLTTSFNSSANQVAITGSGVSLPATVRFDERGRALLTDCVSSPPPSVPLLYFCDGSCASVTNQNATAIYISPTGTVSMMTGGTAAPTFSNPAVSNVNSNTTVNPLLTVWLPATPTPTPTPVVTPTPTPAATPVTRDCVASPFEKPSATGCYCRPPMWVRSNDFCK